VILGLQTFQFGLLSDDHRLGNGCAPENPPGSPPKIMEKQPGTPAAWQASFQLIRRSLIGPDPRANINSPVRGGIDGDIRL